jgi:hypothetical protein
MEESKQMTLLLLTLLLLEIIPVKGFDEWDRDKRK